MAPLRTCRVVGDGCLRPPGFRSGRGVAEADASDMEGPAATCYACGDDVCRNLACSSIRTRKVPVQVALDVVKRIERQVRICADCIEAEEAEEEPARDLEERFETGDLGGGDA
jgi:hypothetical protein